MTKMDSTIQNPCLPYVGPLPGPLQPGHLIKISGTVSSSATCFSINLQTSANGSQRNDIALHLSPVFSPPPRLVRNSLENQKWGPEESHGPYFPFSCGQGFEILILVETDHFKIAVNGQHFTEYHYRLPLYSVSHLAIDGDVTINLIKFEGLARSPMDSGSGEGINKPLGFVIDPNSQQNLSQPPATSGRPSSPYGSMPYPTSFGPSPTTPYGPPSMSSPQGPSPYGPSPMSSPQGLGPYGPSSTYNPYGPSPQGNTYPSGRVSPSPYPAGASSPYGPPPGGSNPYSQHQGYPQQPGAYPSQGIYPSSNPYPGTTVVYPDQGKSKSDSGYLGPIAAAGAAALAGAAGSALMHGKHKKSKHSHGIPGMLGGHGAGPASLIGGVGSLLSGGKHGHSGSSPIPIGGAVAGGAAALAGAYMLSKSPMGKVMKPKKLKKLYKHKHKGGWGGFGSSSSSSSSDEE